VLLLEDLHWAEDPLLDLVERVVDELQVPLLVLGTARPDVLERESWLEPRVHSTRVSLAPLTGEETNRIVDDLLGEQVPGSLRELVTSWAEGNPFFLEELIGMLIDQGVLRRSADGWSARDLPAEFAIPDSVQALLAARIDLLGQAEKGTLQAAAVIGRNFRQSALESLLEGAPPGVLGLEERDFIRRSAGSAVPGDDEYAFKHALTREVAYGSLPRAKRARLHAAFAAWSEVRPGGAGDDDAPLLAHHYGEAARPDHADLAWPGEEDTLQNLRERAVYWQRRAAELAIARYALDEAVALLRAALELEPSESDQVELWRAIGRASVLNFDGESFWGAMQRAADLSRDEETVATIYADLAIETATRSGMWRGRPDEGVMDSWIEQALALAPRESAARAKALAASSYIRAGAKDEAREATDIAELLGDDELRSFAVEGLFATATAALEYQEACEWAQLRLAIARGISDPDHRAEAYLSAICAHLAVGRIPEARQLARALGEVSAELTPHHRLHVVAYGLFVDAADGGWRSIRELARRTEQAVAANEATPCMLNAWSLLACAIAHVHAGDLEEARRLEQSADVVARPESQLTATAKAGLALARGDLGAVAELLPAEPLPRGGRPPWDAYLLPVRLDALTALRDHERLEKEAPPLLLPGTYFEPFALRALGAVREEAELLEQAAVRFEAMELRWHAEQTRALLGG
jgi:hypothetical protein